MLKNRESEMNNSPSEGRQKGDAETDICLEKRGGDGGEVMVNEGNGMGGGRGRCNRKTLIIIVIILLLLIIAIIIIVSVLLTSVMTPSMYVHFAKYYNDSMVLQRSPQRAVVWGYASITDKSNATIVLDIIGASDSYHLNTTITRTDEGNVWSVVLPAIAEPGPYLIRASHQYSPDIFKELKNVLFGEVWLCATQYNIHLDTLDKILVRTYGYSDRADWDKIRFMKVSPTKSNKPLSDLQGISIPWTSKDYYTRDMHIRYQEDTYTLVFPSICWNFAHKLQGSINRPIGIVAISYDDSKIDDWISTTTVKKCWSQTPSVGPPPTAKPSQIWNGMINPILNVQIAGLIFIPGDADIVDSTKSYSCMFKDLISHWREAVANNSSPQTYLANISSVQIPLANRSASQPIVEHEMETVNVFPVGLVQIWPRIADNTLYQHYRNGHTYRQTALRWMQTANYGHVPNPALPATFIASTIDLTLLNNTANLEYSDEYGMAGLQVEIAIRLLRGALTTVYGLTNMSYPPPMPISYMMSRELMEPEVPSIYMRLNVSFDVAGGVCVRFQHEQFEVCCSNDTNLTCDPFAYTDKQWDSNSTLSWRYARIDSKLDCIDFGQAAIQKWIQIKFQCRHHVTGLRYAWHDIPCMRFSCGIYTINSTLPMAPFIQIGGLQETATALPLRREPFVLNYPFG